MYLFQTLLKPHTYTLGPDTHMLRSPLTNEQFIEVTVLDRVKAFPQNKGFPICPSYTFISITQGTQGVLHHILHF